MSALVSITGVLQASDFIESQDLPAFGVIAAWRNPLELHSQLQFASIWARVSPILVHHTNARTSALGASRRDSRVTPRFFDDRRPATACFRLIPGVA
jgi:hypothetical protein